MRGKYKTPAIVAGVFVLGNSSGVMEISSFFA